MTYILGIGLAVLIFFWVLNKILAVVLMVLDTYQARSKEQYEQLLWRAKLRQDHEEELARLADTRYPSKSRTEIK